MIQSKAKYNLEDGFMLHLNKKKLHSVVLSKHTLLLSPKAPTLINKTGHGITNMIYILNTSM